MTPDPKPEARYVAGPDEWSDLLDRLKERFPNCQACGADGWLVPLTAHHIVPKSLGGGDKLGNLARVCGTGTTGCHGRIENREPEACSLLRNGMTEWQTAHVLETKGQDFLDRYYPLPEGGATATARSDIEKTPATVPPSESGEGHNHADPPSPLEPLVWHPLYVGQQVDIKADLPRHTDEELEPCSACSGTGKRKKREKREPARPRVNVGIAVPKDEQEDGAEVLKTLIDECRKELLEQMGWKENVPPYFVLTAVMADWLASRR